MTKLDLAGIRARAEAATAGKWFATCKLEIGPRSDADDQSFGMVIAIADAFNSEDAAHITGMDPPTTLALVDEVKRLTRERDEALAEVSDQVLGDLRKQWKAHAVDLKTR